ncbi:MULTISPECIES: pyridoxal phosphate-dependent aminotransferase [Bacillus]|uniref:pyridoxal phosphate-dependent aminotransferase n=1 Tax=Bacillus TaxID=1386 RepID=UPI000319510F|nr:MULTISPECIES: aminotransferase class I/II-fold pyridoxal phosphate-dependent enzyme [Bacillus]
MKTKWPEHGGKTSVIASILQDKGMNSFGLKDFSANINPFGIPSIMVEAMMTAIVEKSNIYPDLTYKEHTEKVANYEEIASNQVLLTNGGAEAIHLSASLFKGKKAAIFHPTFSEYEWACKANGVSYTCYLYEEYWNDCILPNNWEKVLETNDAIFVCRPNNPSGTRLSFEVMKNLVEKANVYGTYVVVDEAFIHFSPNEKSVKCFIQQYSNLIVLRSLTKIFAVPGVRLGYIMADEQTINQLSQMQVPWSVNAVALSLIECLPECDDFIKKTAAFVLEEKVWLTKEFQKLGFEISNTYTNYYLLRDPLLDNHETLLLFLVEKGILVRHTYNFLDIEGKALRIAIRTREENESIVRHLKEWRERA